MMKIDKKHFIEVECGVCNKTFKKPMQILHKTDDPNFLIAEIEYCSDKCREIEEKTWKNIQDTCGCGRKVENYNGDNGFTMDFKNKKCYPVCDVCTEITAKFYRKEIGLD